MKLTLNSMNKPTLYVLCGISSSGKSSWGGAFIKHNWANKNIKMVSTDAIRKELWGSEEDQQNPKLVFDTAYGRVHDHLIHNYDTVFDATNLSKRDRERIIEKYSDIANLICVDFGNDVERSLKLQESRERKVPENVIRKQASKYNKPTFEEGWCEIIDGTRED